MARNSVLFKLVLAATVLALVQMACSMPGSGPTSTPAAGSGGVVKGVVYGDINGNGVVDTGEGPLAGVQVTLASCGAVQNQITPADGSFNFSGLPTGTCQVSATKTSWQFSASVPSLGYPIPVASDPALPTAFSILMAPDFTPVPGATTLPLVPGATTPAPVPGATTPALVPSDTSTPTATATLGAPMLMPTSANANCRFGPGTVYVSLGTLLVGQTVPILGTIQDQSWWQIDNPDSPGTQCWVANSVTTTSGDISIVPIVAVPASQVIGLKVTTPAVVHGTCGGPNPTYFMVSITTNGPATVVYHLEIYNSDGTLRNKTDNATRTFASADTQTFDPGGAYKTDCGKFTIKVIVTIPNYKMAQASWSVVYP